MERTGSQRKLLLGENMNVYKTVSGSCPGSELDAKLTRELNTLAQDGFSPMQVHVQRVAMDNVDAIKVFYTIVGQGGEFVVPAAAESPTMEMPYEPETPPPSARNKEGFTVEEFPEQPIATSLSDLCTAKQLGAIRAIARELDLEPNEVCQDTMDCRTDELSKKAASALIQHLKKLQSELQAPTEP